MNIWFFRTLGGFKSLGVLARGLQETGARPTGTPASATRGGTLPLQVLPPAFAFSVTSSGSPLFLLLLASSLPFWHRLKGTGIPLEGCDPASDSECRAPVHTEHLLCLGCPQQPHAGEPYPACLQAPSTTNGIAVNILIHLLAHSHK